jgi:hypothetical protein
MIKDYANRLVRAGDLPGEVTLKSCYYVFEYFFGREWLDSFVLPGSKYPGYMTYEPTKTEDRHEGIDLMSDPPHVIKAIGLAELLVNLKEVEGFDGRADDLFHTKFESTIAELELGMFLYRQGMQFRYVDEAHRKRDDYDMELIYDRCENVCAEIKCKLDGSEYDADRFLRAIKKIGGQMPDNVPCAIFVKVPQGWVLPSQSIGLNDTLERILARYFGNTKKIVLAVFYAKVVDYGRDVTAIRHIALEKENPNSTFSRLRSWKLFDNVSEAPHWISMNELIGGGHGSV